MRIHFLSGDIPPHYNNKHRHDYVALNHRAQVVDNNAKALTLRELYLRQIGNYFGAYKRLLFGRTLEEQSTPRHNNTMKHSNMSNSSKFHPTHRHESLGKDQVDLPKHSCLRKVCSVPATHYTPAFKIKEDKEKEEKNEFRQNRVSYDSLLNDKDEVDAQASFQSDTGKRLGKTKSHLRRRHSTKSRNIGSRLSLIFGMEDMTTDSTSILKDSRHPSISTISGNQSILLKNTGIDISKFILTIIGVSYYSYAKIMQYNLIDKSIYCYRYNLRITTRHECTHFRTHCRA